MLCLSSAGCYSVTFPNDQSLSVFAVLWHRKEEKGKQNVEEPSLEQNRKGRQEASLFLWFGEECLSQIWDSQNHLPHYVFIWHMAGWWRLCAAPSVGQKENSRSNWILSELCPLCTKQDPLQKPNLNLIKQCGSHPNPPTLQPRLMSNVICKDTCKEASPQVDLLTGSQ